MPFKRTARIAVILVVLCILPASVFAQANLLPGQIVPQKCNVQGGCQSICDLAEVAQNVLNTGIYIAVFLSAVLFALAGFKYLTNVANSGEISRAKEIFMNVAVGLIIILAGWLVIDTLMKTLVNQDAGFGPWNKVCELFFQHVSAFV